MGVELVGKIGSMALIDSANQDIDYNKFARIGRSLRPGMVWVSSGATEIGRIDYIRRNGSELVGENEQVKTDYSSQGQAILMSMYRQFIDSQYSVRQVLVEHQHFNDSAKRAHLQSFLRRCYEQRAIPIINYNDCVSSEETRKFEIQSLKAVRTNAVELVDNDETASQIACLLGAKNLVILTTTDGIYRDKNNKDSLISTITGKSPAELSDNIDIAKSHCNGSSRAGANGAGAKLEYIKACAMQGTTVFIANSTYGIQDVLSGKAPSTRIGLTQS